MLALSLVPLSAADRRAASLVCKDWRDAINQTWAEDGISVRDNATSVLMQARWDGLGRLRIYGPGDPRERTPLHGLPRELPRLWHLHLRRVSLAIAPGLWASVFRQAPSLRSVDLELQMYVNNYAGNLTHARSLLIQGAERLESAALRGHGLVVYPTGVVQDSAFYAAQECRSWPPVYMDRLKTFVNTGRQFACLAVDSWQLRHAEIEEPDSGSWILGRMGRGCGGMTTLKWSVPTPISAAAFPMFALVERFQRLRDLDVTFRNVKNLGAVLDSLGAVPHRLQTLAVYVEINWPCDVCDWDKTPLRHLTQLRALDLRVTYATRGFETAFGLLGAPDSVQEATLGAKHSLFPCITTDADSDADTDADDDTDDTDDEDMLYPVSSEMNPRVARALLERRTCRVVTENLPVTLKHDRLHQKIV